MDKLVGVLSGTSINSKNDDDFADRLSSRYSVVVLVVFALVVSANHYIGSPITCWAPVHFTGSHTKFTNSYCWVRNTYYLPFDQNIPRAHEHDKRQMIPYYQWIPFILLAQALFFYLPTIIWHGLNSKAGVDADNILEASHKLTRTDHVDNHQKILSLVVNQMDRFLKSRNTSNTCQCDFNHLLSATCCRLCGTRFGNYLVILFMISKILYIANAIAQLFILNMVLGTDFNNFGFELMENFMADHDWTEAEFVAFPRVTMCDFNIRRLGNVHRYTVQCVLPFNLYNEKIYVFLWFWIVFVALVSVLSFLVWMIRFIFSSDRVMFVQNHLALNKLILQGDHNDKDESKNFVTNYLKQDGAFLLRLIAHNTNNITTTEVTCALFEHWREKRARRKQKNLQLDDVDSPPKKSIYPNPHLADTMELQKPLKGAESSYV